MKTPEEIVSDLKHKWIVHFNTEPSTEEWAVIGPDITAALQAERDRLDRMPSPEELFDFMESDELAPSERTAFEYSKRIHEFFRSRILGDEKVGKK